MALNRIKYKTPQRIAKNCETGEEHLVIARNLGKRTVDLWQDVTGYNSKELRVEGLITVDESRVILCDVYAGPKLAERLFAQFSGDHTGVADGTHLVTTKSGFTSVQVNSNWGTPHESLECPVHGTPMNLRCTPQGGVFYGCQRYISDECKITVGADGRWRDPEGWLS